MTKNINTAFSTFIKDYVNLEATRVEKGRYSRNWLINQIELIAEKYDDFPSLYKNKNIFFGSFARNTKIRPLDDIDIMICLNANGTTYSENALNIELNTKNSNQIFKDLCHDNSENLNSTRVINKFKSYLKDIPQYSNAEIHKNHEALTLKLSSYEWNFDIVPCFFTAEDSYGRTYYIIPDGKGNWKKTDPRIDKENLTSLNQELEGNLLNVIRLVKYWNKKKQIGINSSYLLETMIIKIYSEKAEKTCSKFVDIAFVEVLSKLKSSILNSVEDLKGIQGDLNSLDYWDRIIISSKIENFYNKSVEAREYEANKDLEKCFSKWREILGDDFPKYE